MITAIESQPLSVNAKPVFKYIGGKTWLSEKLNKKLKLVLKKKDISTYIEPFAGGLGSFLALQEQLLSSGVKNIVLNDINSHVISLYQQIQKNPTPLIKELHSLEIKFKELIPKNIDPAILTKEDLIGCEWFFKSQREIFNTEKQSKKELKLNSQKLLGQSARLIFLQRHAFNGIYRENASGGYNSPFNWSAKSANDYEDNIKNLHIVFSKFNLEFTKKSFSELIPQYNNFDKDKTLLYLDPPYVNPEQGSGAENKYSKSAFGMQEQMELIRLISDFNFIYSNHYDNRLIKEMKNMTKGLGDIKAEKIGRRNIMTAKAQNRGQLIEEALVVFVKK